MQDFLNPKLDSEIDLQELFLTLWAYKIFISSVCSLGILFGGYYALNAKKIYEAVAIFSLQGNDSGGFSLNNQMSALAGIAGIANLNSNSAIPTDKVTGRIFIEKLDTKLDFKADPYFNSYDPNIVEPVWKSIIKRAIGWQTSFKDINEIIWQRIISKYISNVTLESTDDGSIKVMVTHINAERAAKIANAIMDEIITSLRIRNKTIKDQQLAYLSTTLANSLNDLEKSQFDLKAFTLENSALPLENFAAGSIQLDQLREQLNRTSELHEAVAALSLILQNKTTNQANYVSLRQKHPIVDQVEFRRVLGQNEIISSWNWPNAESVFAVFDTLSDRKSRLQSQINASQIEAERSSLALDAYAKLERDAKVAEATYTILIEQVKAQTLLAGFEPDKTTIYEYAYAPIIASSPNRNQAIALGAIIGMVFGAMLSLLFARQRGVFFSKNSLKASIQARFTARLRTLKPLRNKSLKDVNTILKKKPYYFLRDMAVGIHNSAVKQVVITSSHAKLTGNEAARVLASYMQSDTIKIALIDFSSKNKKLDINAENRSIGSFVISESTNHISVLRPASDLAAIELLSNKDFWRNNQLLNSTFDLVFLCADNDDAISLVSALEGQKVFHITLARTKNTKSASLMRMSSLLPIQGLLYD